ncbi:hypothetical protein [Kibdelosporangium philippinense]
MDTRQGGARPETVRVEAPTSSNPPYRQTRTPAAFQVQPGWLG